MASTSTRMLLLGAVQLFEPVNGYQIRRELVSWWVDEWAHINPGSIYSGLETLARAGHLAGHPLTEGSRTVTVYTTTPEGRAEFQRLFAEAVRVHDRGSARGFTTALSLAPLVTREVFLGLLEEPLAAAPAEALPPHLPPLVALWNAQGRTEREWLVGMIASLHSGDSWYAGETAGWAPPPDDPGWAMQADRERYRQALGLND